MSNNPDKQGQEDIVNDGFSGFLQKLAGYYSQFLETDFKSIRQPKRVYTEKQGQMRIGFQLSTFPSLQNKFSHQLDQVDSSRIVLKHGQYKASLGISVRKGITAAIAGLNLESLKEGLSLVQSQLAKNAEREGKDFDQFSQNSELLLHNTLIRCVVEPVLQVIKPVLEHQSGAAAATQDIETFSDEIANLLLDDLNDNFLDALGTMMFSQSPLELSKVFTTLAQEKRIKPILSSYFEQFVSQDAFVQVREMMASLQLMENCQFYLNVGEVSYNRTRFPLYYIPISINFDEDTITIDLNSTIYANKKLIDYLLGQLNKTHKLTTTNPIDERILHKTTEQSHYEHIFDTFYRILAALFVDGDIDLKATGLTQAERYGIKVSNRMTVTIADKSDESIVNDYEQLMIGLDETDPLVESFKEIVESFLQTDPESVEPEIENEWDNTPTAERLVFQSPLPLAEEQRKVLSALKNPKSKYVIVEGPPGCGKSHSITAIAFEMILNNQNVLILSDKKEALDVVEGKLNDVISKVRGKDIEYVNPILRLGKTDSNYSNIIKRSSIDKLKTSVKQFKTNQTNFHNQYDGLRQGLKTNVNNTIEAVETILMSEIKAFHEQENILLDKYPVLADIPESVDDEIGLISKTHKLVEQYRELFGKVMGEQPSAIKQNILNYLAFLPSLNDLSQENHTLINKYPKLKIDKVNEIPAIIDNIIDLRLPIFGYLFAGAKLCEYSKALEEITGIRWEKPQTKFSELRSLIDLPDTLLSVLRSYHIGSSSLKEFYNSALAGTMDKESADDLQCFFTTEFDLAVAEIFPTKIEDHLTLAPNIITLLHEFSEFLALRASLKEKFDNVPEYDYLGDKTHFEQMNTMMLVQQIDERVTKFATEHQASAKTLQQIIRQKSKFPKDKFDILKDAFPCIIAGLRDFAEFIPLEPDLFDLVIIDEASQVSIAQSLPALLRAKKVLVLGDRRQFGNVKTANASKKINEGYFAEVMEAFKTNVTCDDISQSTRLTNFNISYSVMDFFEMTNNYAIQLKKHFRGYPELISLSSKYFYDEGLQALKVRGKPIDEVLEFVQSPDLERIETHRNVNEQEASIIFERLVQMLKVEGDLPSVAIISPFRDQVTYLQRFLSDMPEREMLQKRLKLAIFTLDTCQGEERDYVFYSMVANRMQDGLNYILPRELKVSEDEVDGNLKMQRVNVGFSRAKEKIVFIHSKPINEFNGSARLILQHYLSVKEAARKLPDNEQTDLNSPMEAKLLEWMKSTTFVNKNADNLEIIPQFELGNYLKSINPTYSHPAYKVDFLMRLTTPDEKIVQAIIEYDGFEFHFDISQRHNIQADNWRSYLTADDVERECVLESFGYKMLRINRFNITNDPVTMLDKKLSELFAEHLTSGESHAFINGINKTIEAIDSGEMKACSNCGQAKPIESFKDSTLKSGVGRKCSDCKGNKKTTTSQGWRKPRRRRWH